MALRRVCIPDAIKKEMANNHRVVFVLLACKGHSKTWFEMGAVPVARALPA